VIVPNTRQMKRRPTQSAVRKAVRRPSALSRRGRAASDKGDSVNERGREAIAKPRSSFLSSDPRMSEWGNPLRLIPEYLHLNP
jgi:hypothetical protein